MIKCAAIFTDHMVLLRNKRVCVWGQCDSDGLVTVSIDKIQVETEIIDGNWKVYLPEHKEGGPYVLSIIKDDEILTSIKELVEKNLARFSWPYEYEFRDELPKTTVGKILRRVLIDEEKRKNYLLRNRNYNVFLRDVSGYHRDRFLFFVCHNRTRACSPQFC